MKFKYYFSFCIILLFVNCKKDISATIKLKIELDNKNSSEYPDLTQLKVYKDGKFFKKFVADKMIYINHEITLPKIKGGKYQFEYQNFFHQKMIKTLIVDDSKTYNVSINPDYSNYKENLHKSIVGNLKNGDSLQINFETRGCFKTGKDSVILKRVGKEFILKIDRKEIKLQNEGIDFLKRAECELYELPNNGGCTTSDTYTLIFKGKELSFVDSTCNWNAWSNIYEKFIWKEKNGR